MTLIALEDEKDEKDLVSEISPIHAQSMASHIWSLYTSKSCTDVRVNCGNRTYDLHSCVLTHGSPYFQRVLTGKVSNMTMELDPAFPVSTETSTFDIIVESLYTGIVPSINESNVTLVLGAGHDLQVSHVLNGCCNLMMKTLTLDNCLEYLLAAMMCNLDELKIASMEFVGRHLQSISKLEFFLNLQESTVLDILIDDHLQVPSEQVVYDAGMTWIKYDEEGRKGSLNAVLDTIRLPMLPVNFLISIVGNEYLIENNNDALNRYSRALQYKLNATKARSRSNLKSMNDEREILSEKSFVARHSLSYAVKGALERYSEKSFCCWKMDDDRNAENTNSNLEI